MANEPNWREIAFELYREAQVELSFWKDLHGGDIEYWIDELKEALLDLKEATIAEEPARVNDCVQEIVSLLFELHRRRQGD